MTARPRPQTGSITAERARARPRSAILINPFYLARLMSRSDFYALWAFESRDESIAANGVHFGPSRWRDGMTENR